MRWGYTCSSEEFAGSTLVDLARRAEDEGFEFVTVSDHFHPWVEAQGHSPFAWSTLGGIAATTDRVSMGTGVTCPLIRQHPTVVAQAAASVDEMSGGRFFLGVGTGEALNEHVTGRRWPAIEERQQMLVEAVSVMRALWTGDTLDHAGTYYRVENARLFTTPAHDIEVVWAASGPKSAALAAEHGDAMWCTSPDESLVQAYRDGGGAGRVIGQMTICWADDEAAARRTALQQWPTAAIGGQLSQDLPTWTHFAAATELADEDDVAATVVCGPDEAAVVEMAQRYARAGVTDLHVHQVGPEQDAFFDAWSARLRDALGSVVS